MPVCELLNPIGWLGPEMSRTQETYLPGLIVGWRTGWFYNLLRTPSCGAGCHSCLPGLSCLRIIVKMIIKTQALMNRNSDDYNQVNLYKLLQSLALLLLLDGEPLEVEFQFQFLKVTLIATTV